VSFENFYTLFDLSPFAVHVHSATTHTQTTLHSLHVCHIISQIAYNDIIESRKIGRDKILVELKTASVANNLVKCFTEP